MPKMQCLDNSQGHTQQQTPQGVCKPPSLLDAGTPRRGGTWPFKYTLQDNRWYVNKGKRARKDPNRYEESPW